MDIGKTLYVSTRDAWRDWLAANFSSEMEIWLIYPSRASDQPRLTYNDAVEEALSFGWIDSTVKRFGENASAQRFTPRRPQSDYSQANKERLRWLLKEGKIHPSIRVSVVKALKTEFRFPLDILQAIKKNERAWKNYQTFTPSYQRIRIAYIESARKRPDEFKKRLFNFISKTEQNRMFGFGGIEKYY
jgi:uncharacterized protein YdeI (YjbR/CyaY-like superfamily)